MGDPALVQREMQRLARLAHRIVRVNPRAGASEFDVQVGGMVAALPFCDAVWSAATALRLSTRLWRRSSAPRPPSEAVELVRRQTDALGDVGRVNDSGVRILHAARSLRKVAVGK